MTTTTTPKTHDVSVTFGEANVSARVDGIELGAAITNTDDLDADCLQAAITQALEGQSVRTFSQGTGIVSFEAQKGRLFNAPRCLGPAFLASVITAVKDQATTAKVPLYQGPFGSGITNHLAIQVR